MRSGQTIGLVVDPLEGAVRQEVKAPCAGLLFALRTYPVVYPGSLIARILED
jgi:predicted deacylase